MVCKHRDPLSGLWRGEKWIGNPLQIPKLIETRAAVARTAKICYLCTNSVFIANIIQVMHPTGLNNQIYFGLELSLNDTDADSNLLPTCP
jgi:hypothetical protein